MGITALLYVVHVVNAEQKEATQKRKNIAVCPWDWLPLCIPNPNRTRPKNRINESKNEFSNSHEVAKSIAVIAVSMKCPPTRENEKDKDGSARV